MNKLKKLMAVLVCMAMTVAGVPVLTVSAANYEGETDDGLGYTVYDDHVEITYGDAENLIIPGEIDGLPVTHIGDYAFSDCGRLTTVTIPGSVTSIGEGAFNWCTGLTSVTIPSSVTSIGSGAFNLCTSLTSVFIPSSVTVIGEEPFRWCNSLTEILVDDNNANYISRDGVLFNKDATELIQYPVGSPQTAYIIPEGISIISNYAFCDCTGLTSVTIPEA